MNHPVSIQLTRPEALVLSDWLARVAEGEERDLGIIDHAERVALWNLSATLETALPELLRPDYKQLLAEARDAIRGTT